MKRIRSFFRSLFRRLKNLFTGNGWVDDDPGQDIVDYYGCPNSKKAKALQLGRKAVR